MSEFEGMTSAQHMYRLLHDLYLQFDDRDRRALSPFQLTNTQYTLLNLLDPFEGQRLTTLSDRLFCVRSTVTRMIDQLEAAGLVHRIGDPDDRRAHRVMLTETGVELRRQARLTHAQSVEARLSSLDEADQQQLVVLLDQIRSHLYAGHDLQKEVAAE